MTVKIGINGFGRIGRNYLRAARLLGADVEVVAVNDLTSPETLAHLLKYDSTHGRFGSDVTVDGSDLVLDSGPVAVLAERDPKALPWKDLGVDVVIESTGTSPPRRRPVPTSTPAPRGSSSRPRARASTPRSWSGSTTTCSTRPRTSWCPTPRAPPTASSPWSKCSMTPSGGVRAHDHRARLHQRPEPPRPAAQGPPTGPGRGRQHRPGVLGGARATSLVLESMKAASTAPPSGCRCRTGRSPTSPRWSRRGDRRAGQRGLPGRRIVRAARARPRLHRGPDRLERHRRQPASCTFDAGLTMVMPSASGSRWSRSAAGTTTSGATPTGWSTCPRRGRRGLRACGGRVEAHRGETMT